tara:strand:+ start:559 stop:804 length:246 start_codon:yes stop_codon:yes gene_type:complete
VFWGIKRIKTLILIYLKLKIFGKQFTSTHEETRGSSNSPNGVFRVRCGVGGYHVRLSTLNDFENQIAPKAKPMPMPIVLLN